MVNILDDTMLLDQDPDFLRNVAVPRILQTCDTLHLTINYPKSVLQPVQRLVWHGVLWCFDIWCDCYVQSLSRWHRERHL
eukprot:COSAG01_NODE_8775_length_2663_cov_8.996880_1_plen_80_part_00